MRRSLQGKGKSAEQKWEYSVGYQKGKRCIKQVPFSEYSMLLPMDKRAFISLCGQEREFLSLQRMTQKNSITCQFCFSAVKAECYFVGSYLKVQPCGFPSHTDVSNPQQQIIAIILALRRRVLVFQNSRIKCCVLFWFLIRNTNIWEKYCCSWEI